MARRVRVRTGFEEKRLVLLDWANKQKEGSA
jgi:hypothetical protein